MTHDQDTTIDVLMLEARESWLRSRVVDAPPTGVERIKLRVSLAVHEAAMASSMSTEPADGFSERTRMTVRRAIGAASEESAKRGVQRARRVAWWSGITAAAAVVAFALLRPPFEAEDAGRIVDGDLPIETLSAADMFELTSDDELDHAVASLEESLSDLEMNVGGGWASTGDDLFGDDEPDEDAAPRPDDRGDKSGSRSPLVEFMASSLDSTRTGNPIAARTARTG